MNEEEIIATLTLSRLQGLSQQTALRLIEESGSAVSALSGSIADPSAATLLADRSLVGRAREAALREYDYCRQRNIQMLVPTSDEYPRRISQPLSSGGKIAERPLQLFYLGNANLNCRRALAVIGTRNITEYGKQAVNAIVRDLAQVVPDLLIVSGLAYGVDIHAHRAALQYGLDTIGVVAHGLDRVYPSAHRQTAAEMVHHGGMLTEYFTGVRPERGRFVMRNRIVSAITDGVLVIESGTRGGSLITVARASEYERTVMSIPGRITDDNSAGCNRLLAQGKAKCVTEAGDVLFHMGWEATKAAANPVQPSLFPDFELDPDAQRVLQLLNAADDMTTDRLAREAGVTMARLSDILYDLEDADRVKRLPGNRYTSIKC